MQIAREVYYVSIYFTILTTPLFDRYNFHVFLALGQVPRMAGNLTHLWLPPSLALEISLCFGLMELVEEIGVFGSCHHQMTEDDS